MIISNISISYLKMLKIKFYKLKSTYVLIRTPFQFNCIENSNFTTLWKDVTKKQTIFSTMSKR